MGLTVYLEVTQPTVVYDRNITHNLSTMATACVVSETLTLYDVLWCPLECDLYYAHELIPLLEAGFKELNSDPQFFKRYNPKNGWGSYEGLVDYVYNYLIACKLTPNAEIKVSK